MRIPQSFQSHLHGHIQARLHINLVSAASFQCRDFEECLGKNWEAHIGNHSYGPMVDYVPMELVTYIGGMQLISPIA